jgi:hypothetical protein
MIVIQQIARKISAPVATSRSLGLTATASTCSRRVTTASTPSPHRPMARVITKAPSLARPPITNPEPGMSALITVRPSARGTVRARCAR